MKTTKRTLVSTALALGIGLSNYVFAQGSSNAGNGGGAVVCRNPNNEITTAILLDLYEGKSILGSQYITSKNFFEISKTLIEQIKNYQKSFALQIETETNKITQAIELNSNYVKFTNDPLERIYDSYNLTMPKDCKIEQAAVRLSEKQSLSLGGVSYLINREIWDALDDLNKSALVFHEAAYKLSGHTDSVLTRQLVRSIFDVNLNFITLTQSLFNFGYKFLIPSRGEMNYFVNSVKIEGNYIEMYPNRVKFLLAYDRYGKLNPKMTEGQTEYRISAEKYRQTFLGFGLKKGEDWMSVSINGVNQKTNSFRRLYVETTGHFVFSDFVANPFDTLSYEMSETLSSERNINKIGIPSQYHGLLINLLLPNIKLED